ncbi:MAG: acetyl-CoA synthetase [Candidatus Methanolliviera hydrocarbonicum]|uniref:acetate--CoA ligase (ADP-forming) n=1 Tax=Candidatus Methanolliviera hydrocarbonicum TaxID=2491085 RepID=A0A520KXS7_9EURY|nr:MAG: acetyl-CoA synthetase [Candidatus Methanolliviera hydrocarbonicum]
MKDLSAIFEPRSVAIVGASANPVKWGCIIPSNILMNSFDGGIYLINPKGEEILGMEVYKNIKDVPGEVDLAIIVRPSETCLSHIEECVDKGVKSIILLSGGFSEAGDGGTALENRIVDVVRGKNVPLVGPNTMGIYSAPVSLSALMPPVTPKKGPISFISQSGNIGTNILSFGGEMGLGFNKFVSCGNAADIDIADYLEYLDSDQKTKVVVLYMEGVRDGRKFMDVAKRVSLKKPIIAYKAGKTAKGVMAAASHTGALAGSSKVYQSAFKQCGITEASTVNEITDLARAFLYLPLPKGNKVGIVTWGGGYGVVATDACEDAGLEVPELDEEVLEALDKILPPYWSKGNPVDLVAMMEGVIEGKMPDILDILVKSDGIDAVIASGYILGGINPTNQKTEGFTTFYDEVNRNNVAKIIELMKKYEKPIIPVTTVADQRAVQRFSEEEIVIYSSLESTANILAKMFGRYKYLEW